MLFRALLFSLVALPLRAEVVQVPPGADVLRAAIAAARPGDVLMLTAGTYGPAVIDKPLTVDGQGKAVVDGGHKGTVLLVTADDVTLRGLTVQGSGARDEDIDSGIKVIKGVARTVDGHPGRLQVRFAVDNAQRSKAHGFHCPRRSADVFRPCRSH